MATVNDFARGHARPRGPTAPAHHMATVATDWIRFIESDNAHESVVLPPVSDE
jgi:hypothetical protein